MIGRVVSVKMLKTATVLIETTKKHPLYGKMFVRTKKYLVDDPIGVKLGDLVDLVKIKPISKRKHWRITKVLGTDIVALGTESLKQEASEAIAEVLSEEKEEINEPVSEVSISAVESDAVVKEDKKPKKSAKKENK